MQYIEIGPVPGEERLRPCDGTCANNQAAVDASRRWTHADTPSCHAGWVTPNACVSLLQSSREFFGRTARVGYPSVGIGFSEVVGPPADFDCARTSRATSNQLAVPLPAA